jgi:hypothetical protein
VRLETEQDFEKAAVRLTAQQMTELADVLNAIIKWAARKIRLSPEPLGRIDCRRLL